MVSKKVKLFEEENNSYLEFNINNTCKMKINLNSDDQTDLRNLFYSIIEQATKEDFNFELEVLEGYNKTLYKEISEEYIRQLNQELLKIKQEMPKDLIENGEQDATN